MATIERGEWSSKIGFILAAAGSAIGGISHRGIPQERP